MARLKETYNNEVVPHLVKQFSYSSTMQAPKVTKIILNMGLGDAKQNTSLLDSAIDQLSVISGQRPSTRRARKSIAGFKLREGMPIGVATTLRGERMYEFLDRLISIAIPRIRDFRGLSPRSFDGNGNYSLGIREQIVFPEIDYDSIDQVRGLDVTLTTTAATDEEAFELLSALGMPFRHDPRSSASLEGVDTEVSQTSQDESASDEVADAVPQDEQVVDSQQQEAQTAGDDEAGDAVDVPDPQPENGAGEEPEAAESEPQDDQPHQEGE